MTETRPTVTVHLPGVLVDLFPGSLRRVDVEASTVRDAIDAINQLWPGMRDRICDSRPAIRKHMNVFVDGERRKLDFPLKAGANVFVLTAISGG